MRRHLRGRITYANVISTLALFIALGGTAYAGLQLANNSVRSKHIKNRQVKKADVARNAVNSSKVQNRTLKEQDFAADELPAGPRGPRGFQGPRGLRGQTGPAPTAATSGFVPVAASGGAGTDATLLTVGPVTYTANCLDQGGGQFRLEIRAATSEAGTTLAQEDSQVVLTGTPQMIWFEFGTAAESRSHHHWVFTPSGHSHRAAALFGHHQGTANCLARVDVDA